MNRSPLIIAHRGASAHAPENTLAAFEMAVGLGADGIEFDVRLARDGVPVVIHDSTLERTGLRIGNVAEMTSAELARMNVGSWFNLNFPERADASFADERISSLELVLETLAGFGGLIYIELKCGDDDFSPLARAVCDVVRRSPLLPQVIIKSFKLAAIPVVRHYLPEVQTAALFGEKILDFFRRRRYILAVAREFGAQQISLNRSLVTPKLIRLATEMDMPVTIWTADNPKWIKRCRKLGIRSLITNDPAKLISRSGPNT